MSELRVTDSQLISVAGDLRAVAQETRSRLSGLDGRLSGLLGSEWTGQAGSAFGDVWKRWHEGADKLLQGLDRMADLLDEAAHGYQQTDTSGGAAIDSAGM